MAERSLCNVNSSHTSAGALDALLIFGYMWKTSQLVTIVLIEVKRSHAMNTDIEYGRIAEDGIINTVAIL